MAAAVKAVEVWAVVGMAAASLVDSGLVATEQMVATGEATAKAVVVAAVETED